MVSSGDDYPLLISDYVKKYVVMVGSSVALDVAKSVPGLVVDDTGQVTQISGDPKAVIENLKHEYARLSGFLAESTLNKCLAAYPALAKAGE